MFEKIIFPYDFSKYSESAIYYIKALKSVGAKEIIIVYVAEYEELFTHILYKEIEIKEFERKTRLRLKPVKDEFEKEGFAVTIYVEFGKPSKVIVSKAVKEKANLIVMGAQGQGAISSFFLGSTAANVLKVSPIPVLIIPLKEEHL